MKYITFDEIFSNLREQPSLLKDPYIGLCFRMMIIEGYYSLSNFSTASSMHDYIVKIRHMVETHEYTYWDTLLLISSDVLKSVLAYTILKSIHPHNQYSFTVYTVHLMDDLSTVCLLNSEEDTLISEYGEEVMKESSLSTFALCRSHLLLAVSKKYNVPLSNSYEKPSTLDEIVQWCIRYNADMPEDRLRVFIDSLLQPGSLFVEDTIHMNLWRGDPSNKYNNSLITIILRSKVMKGLNIIFDRYPPYHCGRK